MRLKKRYIIKRGHYLKEYWYLYEVLFFANGSPVNGGYINPENPIECGTKKQCRSKMATLKRRDYLSSNVITETRKERKVRELMGGAE